MRAVVCWSSCGTCGLGYYECPGHFGHIALAVPVYHPLVFPVLYKLLRATCLNCHHFKMDAKRVSAPPRRTKRASLTIPRIQK